MKIALIFIFTNLLALDLEANSSVKELLKQQSTFKTQTTQTKKTKKYFRDELA